jgi:hypothetical protein
VVLPEQFHDAGKPCPIAHRNGKITKQQPEKERTQATSCIGQCPNRSVFHSIFPFDTNIPEHLTDGVGSHTVSFLDIRISNHTGSFFVSSAKLP